LEKFINNKGTNDESKLKEVNDVLKCVTNLNIGLISDLNKHIKQLNSN
jgi:hypothetical protein